MRLIKTMVCLLLLLGAVGICVALSTDTTSPSAGMCTKMKKTQPISPYKLGTDGIPDGTPPGKNTPDDGAKLAKLDENLFKENPRDENSKAIENFLVAWNRFIKYAEDVAASEKFKLTPKEYAELRAFQALQTSSIGDQKADEDAGRDIAKYTRKWVVLNVGDPEKFELTPKQYGEWRALQDLETSSIGDQKTGEEAARDIAEYTSEWAIRNDGDPEKNED